MTDASSSGQGSPVPWVAGAAQWRPLATTVRGLARVPASAPPRMSAAMRGPAHPGRPAQWLLSRARALWPGLSSRQLAETRGDPLRIVSLVARRSNEAPEVLLAMLLGPHAGTSPR